jgi:hypothetical protein
MGCRRDLALLALVLVDNDEVFVFVLVVLVFGVEAHDPGRELAEAASMYRSNRSSIRFPVSSARGRTDAERILLRFRGCDAPAPAPVPVPADVDAIIGRARWVGAGSGTISDELAKARRMEEKQETMTHH